MNYLRTWNHFLKQHIQIDFFLSELGRPVIKTNFKDKIKNLLILICLHEIEKLTTSLFLFYTNACDSNKNIIDKKNMANQVISGIETNIIQ